MTRLSRAWHAAAALAALLGAANVARAQPSVTAGSPTLIRLKGQIVRPSGPIDGEVLIDGNTIKCVAASCPAAGATVIETKGTIYPGMLDARNHALFNFLDEDDWNPGPIFKNHNSWPANDARYKEVVRAKKHLEGPAGLRCEMDKYGELKALIAGTTSTLVAPGATVSSCFGSLARTIDTQFNDLTGKKTISTAISVPTNAGAQAICASLNAKKIKTYVVHVGEGIDETSRNEFDTLRKRAGGCLMRRATTVIHGTNFGTPEFTRMAAKDMALVWSPKSNTFLYARDDGSVATARINLAIAAGVKTIALGPDWALGGSTNLLDELRFANDIAITEGWAFVTPERLFRMVTIDAAKALGVDDQLGSLSVGKRADVMVLAATGDPFLRLLDATPKNVRLVMVDGRVLYGDAALAAAAAHPDCDTFDVCGASKFLCVAEPDGTASDKRKQRLDDITDALKSGLEAYEHTLPAATKKFLPLAPLVRCGT